MSYVIPEGYRLKTDEELAELPVRPWIFGWGDVVDDNIPRKHEWLYKPCCSSCRSNNEKKESELKTEPSNNA